MHAATAFEPVVLARSVPFQHPARSARPLDRAERRRRVEAFLREATLEQVNALLAME